MRTWLAAKQITRVRLVAMLLTVLLGKVLHLSHQAATTEEKLVAGLSKIKVR